ncbi:YkvA family protein [Paenibacillus turpanensis]|uniref:YkvA family protein n=1 Tax=Paenibacillus turpanensis TaxID=2689078 RepID=UPI00140C2D3D|nr:YkvA family protein [Paenibacillus turpanensis]
MAAIGRMKQWARTVKKQLYVLYFAYRDERTGWFAKLFTALVVAYAFSPIDLIPDSIPILGYLDDVILVPLGVMLALKLIPKGILIECRVKADELMQQGKPKNWLAAGVIVLIWVLLFVGVVIWGYQYVGM